MREPVDPSSEAAAGAAALEIRLLGPLAVRRGGVEVALPASRKVRALVAYLAIAPRALTRAHLAELLGDIPNDPRGELRWALSKARGVLDDPGRVRLAASGDGVRLDLDDAFVDALAVDRAMQAGMPALEAPRLHALASLFVGDFLEGLELERSPHLAGWLVAQRRRWRACRAAILEHLAARLGTACDEVFAPLEQWLRLAPFDRRAHELLLEALARRGQMREGEEHLAETARAFEGEGLDWRPLGDAWRDAKARRAGGAAAPAQAIAAPQAAAPAAGSRRASVAVMPFLDRGTPGAPRGGLADGLVHDVITRLAKLRSLFVIAQGTVFALDERQMGPHAVGRTLNVDYVVSGSLRRAGDRILVDVELAEARTACIVWTEGFEEPVGDALRVLDEIGDRIVASIASEVEAAERNRAILKPPSSLDAWEAHHRGLWHMYRFNRADNERARECFETAVRLDPTFARAWAGLSFTHWQNAFQGWSERAPETERAHEAAGRSLVADDRDPAAHWAMGRALWLRGALEPALGELQAAVQLSPNFALGHYTLAFVQSQSGDPHAAIESSDHSRHLSPFDPLLFAMLASRALALVRLGRYEEAATWAAKAAARPNAHVHILAVAVECLALAGRLDEARDLAASIRRSMPGYRVDDFLTAFRFAPDAAQLFRAGARRIGFD